MQMARRDECGGSDIIVTYDHDDMIYEWHERSAIGGEKCHSI